jgi:hypothetical protein
VKIHKKKSRAPLQKTAGAKGAHPLLEKKERKGRGTPSSQKPGHPPGKTKRKELIG